MRCVKYDIIGESWKVFEGAVDHCMKRGLLDMDGMVSHDGRSFRECWKKSEYAGEEDFDEMRKRLCEKYPTLL